MQTSKTDIKVRGFHLDLYKHVNNARYLEFLEEGRWEYYDGVITSDEFLKSGWAFVIVNINISYKSSAVLGDVLEVETGVKRIGGKSIVMGQTIRLKSTGALVVEADVTFVILDVKTNTPCPIEGRLRELLEVN